MLTHVLTGGKRVVEIVLGADDEGGRSDPLKRQGPERYGRLVADALDAHAERQYALHDVVHPLALCEDARASTSGGTPRNCTTLRRASRIASHQARSAPVMTARITCSFGGRSSFGCSGQ